MREREREAREREVRVRLEIKSVERERAEQERAEQELLFRRLKPLDTSYHWDLRCMEGTRQFLLDRVIAWVSPKQLGQEDKGNIYWIYGLPGIGKTSLAHSICASLHEEKHLAGAFFCQRDDPNLSEPRNILPTLIYKLAISFPPFRTIVTESLRDDPNLTRDSMKYTLFLDFLSKLPHSPRETLVFVIDALDECGNNSSRSGVLKVLTDAATQVLWLKIIITSRPEVDIQHFFDVPSRSSYLRYDLATDQNAGADLRTFARSQFDLVAVKSHLSAPWPEESLFNRVISQANGLFIFVKTLVLALEKSSYPTKTLEATLHDSGASSGLEPLYGLYSSIIRAQIMDNHTKFRWMIGVILTTSSYRSLCDDTIATLAGVEPSVVKTWVDHLNSLLYRTVGANGGIRVRHLSISDYFISDHCHSDYRIHLGDANVQLGISCLRTMIRGLRFNICRLEDSRLANADIEDLPLRIKEYIPEELQYSSLYWSNHICPPSANRTSRTLGILKEFFEGLCPLYWIEVLSLMGMVPIGAPSLRRVIPLIKVGTAPASIFCISPRATTF